MCRSRVQSRLTPRQQTFCSIGRIYGEYTRIGDPDDGGYCDSTPRGFPDGSGAQRGAEPLLEAPVHVLGLEAGGFDQPLEAEAEERAAELDRLRVWVGIAAHRPRGDTPSGSLLK